MCYVCCRRSSLALWTGCATPGNALGALALHYPSVKGCYVVMKVIDLVVPYTTRMHN